MKLSWVLLGVCLSLLLMTSVHAQDEDDEMDVADEDFSDAVPLDDDEAQTEELKVPVIEKPKYTKPTVSGNAFLVEPFDSIDSFNQRWVQSKAKKDDAEDEIAKYDGVWSAEEAGESAIEGDLGLVLKSRAKHHAISAKLDKPYEFNGKPFIVQYEVQFQNGQECGGAYLKLLTKSGKLDLNNFVDKTPYTIMFGPDKCGNDDKLHFIFRHKNPVNGKFEEKHAKKPSAALGTFFTDKKTHLYTLVIMPDNTFEVLVDNNLVNSGSLLEDVEPAVNPAKEIVDPEDKKPEDWDEREKIPDPEATKPEDWDESEPAKIDDPDAVKPEGWLDDEAELVPGEDAEKPSDWDDDMDGEWEAPLVANPKCEDAPGCGEYVPPQIDNPKFKGKWKASLIDNPNYKGKWKPRNIANPDFFEDFEPYKMTSIGAVGFELWSMSNDIMFDNLLITDDKAVAEKFAADTWEIKHTQELAGKPSGRSVVDAVMDATNERPWLWAVFIFVIVLPIVLIIAYCCMPSSKADDIAAAKKTDAAQPDDTPEEEEEVDGEKEAENEDEGAGDAPKPKSSPKESKKPSKSDLDADEGDDADAEADEGEDSSDKAQPTRTSPRKRTTKARKE